ncbi:MAG: Two-component system response regulator RacR [uncultured Campylobacterales bacterium]|uniref:Two-component system response regulator RacR n=1 Tax=uncultured Campylobacterales bacterium TaxID=352960 RepID=A0A6S6T2T3_9BACT|nr:MAG: Two-component system response regulator RacR [uncultured Campylobacterales bacterium]
MIEDDTELADMLSKYLSKFNISVTNYEDPFLGLSGLEVEKYDLLILDLGLPGMDGLEVCREVSNKSNIPIIISSARSDITDKVVALEFGADDYLPKPYDPRELEVRIRTILRRLDKANNSNEEILTDVFQVDTAKHEITKKGVSIKLTGAEFDVLSHLINNKGFVISRSDLIDGCELTSESGSIAVIINRIRAKIESDPKNPIYLQTVRGMGYKLVE